MLLPSNTFFLISCWSWCSVSAPCSWDTPGLYSLLKAISCCFRSGMPRAGALPICSLQACWSLCSCSLAFVPLAAESWFLSYLWLFTVSWCGSHFDFWCNASDSLQLAKIFGAPAEQLGPEKNLVCLSPFPFFHAEIIYSVGCCSRFL